MGSQGTPADGRDHVGGGGGDGWDAFRSAGAPDGVRPRSPERAGEGVEREGHLELPRAGNPDAGLRGRAGDAAGVGRRRDERAKAQGDGGRVRRHQVVGQGPRRVPRGRRRRALPRLQRGALSPRQPRRRRQPRAPGPHQARGRPRLPHPRPRAILCARCVPSRARSSSATPAFFSDRRGGAVAPSPSSHPPTADETPPRTFHLRRVGGRGRPGS